MDVEKTLEFLLHDPVQTSSKSVFAHAAFRPTSKLTITTGLRQTDDSKAFTFNRLSLDGTPHPTLGALMRACGPFKLQVRSLHSPFESLARNIVYQQLHGTAAGAIHARLLALVGNGRKLLPRDILAAADVRWR